MTILKIIKLRAMEPYTTVIGVVLLLISLTLNLIFTNLILLIATMVINFYSGYAIMSKDG